MLPGNHKSLFIALSLILFLTIATLFGINYRGAQETLQQSLKDRGAQVRATFSIAYQSTQSSMLGMATFVAHDSHVQQQFLAGVRAVEAEGGGPGGAEAARHRQALHDMLEPAWQRMLSDFDARQLHFHIAPGSLSFLRMHKPHKYGDRMDELRHIIVDSNDDLSSHTGFETGRVYSGIRGVTPIWAEESGQRVHVGAVEVGTSFNEIFKLINRQLDIGIAVLLKRDHVEATMWKEAIKMRFANFNAACGCAVEAVSGTGLDRILTVYAERGVKYPFSEFRTEHIQVGKDHYALTYWPLFDYQAESRHSSDNIGAILMWSNLNAEIESLAAQQRMTLLIALCSFLLIEVLLYSGIRMVTGHLRQQVAQRTAELDLANTRLAELARTDELTGLHNRRYFMEQLPREISRARRNNAPLALVMADLDHFKDINDHYGHQTGDQVLQSVANSLRHDCRDYDLIARYGGEELTLLLPQTSLDAAYQMIERLRIIIASNPLHSISGEPIHLTISFGIAALGECDDAASLIAAADHQLYEAKKGGRNQTCIALSNA